MICIHGRQLNGVKTHTWPFAGACRLCKKVWIPNWAPIQSFPELSWRVPMLDRDQRFSQWMFKVRVAEALSLFSYPEQCQGSAEIDLYSV